MAEIPEEFADVLPPAPDQVDTEAIPPDDALAGAQDTPTPDAPAQEDGEQPAAPDTVEALLEKLEQEDPETAAALLEAIEGKAAAVVEPAKVQAVPGAPVIADEDRVLMEKAEISDVAANMGNTVAVYQQNWQMAYNNYQGAVGALNKYISKCNDKDEEPDPDVLGMYQQHIDAKLIENNRIAQEATNARTQNEFINAVQREIANYPAFGKYPRLYAQLRGQEKILNTMPIPQRLAILMEEAKLQGITAGEAKDPSKIARLRKAVARLKGPKGAGNTTATRRAATKEDNDLKELPQHLRARAEHMLARL